MFALYFLVIYVATTQAIYYIDDQNSSISYTGSWHAETGNGAFDQTLSFVNCTTIQMCQMQIPFTGSGIVIYLSHGADDINVNITIDKNTTTTRTFPHDFPTAGYNFSLYDVQLLPFGNHEVTVLILDWITGNTSSSLYFDYAAVNDSIPSTTQSTTQSTTPSSSASASPSSHANVGAIVGGIIGGLVAIGAAIGMLLCFRWRLHKLQTVELDAMPKPLTLDKVSTVEGNLHASPLPADDATQTATTVPDPSGVPSTTTAAPDVASVDHLQPTRLDIPLTNNSPASNLASSQTVKGTRAQPPIVLTAPLPPSSSAAPLRGTTAQPTSEPIHSISNVLDSAQNEQLTDEQADLVAGLWRANVAAADIARVIERMRAGGGASGSASGDRNPGTSPPSYDVIDGEGVS